MARKHKVIRWVDNGDGTVRKRVSRSQQPQKRVPPRPVPKPVAERNAKPAPFGVYKGRFGRIEAKRLLDRAGLGARPGEAERLAKKGLKRAVHSLTRPQGQAKLVGPAPRDEDGLPLAPLDAWGHDHLWWLDRMVRSDQPFVERMTLNLHDWFATSDAEVGRPDLMIDQNQLLRRYALGNFGQLFTEIAKDPAMLVFLNGIDNHRWAPNENYAREMQELYGLGEGNGYSEDDVRELARALTGWRVDWREGVGFANFRYDPEYHDDGPKTVYGKSGNYDWRDACRLVVEHPRHPGFFVRKLWSYFVPTAPSADTQRELEKLYLRSGREIRPVVEAILMHPDFYRGPRMVKPPVVHLVAMLKARGKAIETSSWSWLCNGAGQTLFRPPNVAGWDEGRWLDTSTMRARWHFHTYMVDENYVEPWPDDENKGYSVDETPKEAVNEALRYWGWPPLSEGVRTELLGFAANAFPARVEEWERGPFRALRQNALRHLISVSPDMHLM